MSEIEKKNTKFRYLLGKGGVGFVMFQLARRHIEFAMASDHCPFGDIWAQTEDGKIGIEVKTSRRGTDWHINRRQIGRAEIYCRVSMDDETCYVLTTAELRASLSGSAKAYDGIAILSQSAIPSESASAWHKITGKVEHPRRKRIKYKSVRRVTRTLRDGTQKTYEYPPWEAPERSATDFLGSKNAEKRENT